MILFMFMIKLILGDMHIRPPNREWGKYKMVKFYLMTFVRNQGHLNRHQKTGTFEVILVHVSFHTLFTTFRDALVYWKLNQNIQARQLSKSPWFLLNVGKNETKALQILDYSLVLHTKTTSRTALAMFLIFSCSSMKY